MYYFNMDIKNIEGISLQEIKHEVKNGGKFVYFLYTTSFLVVTFKRASKIHFVKSTEKASRFAWRYSLLTFLLGWWGIPWGIVYTLQSLATNLKGGVDVTEEVMESLS